MATGDLGNQLRKLRAELRKIQYPHSVETSSVADGSADALLPIIHHMLLEYSPNLLSHLISKKYSLREKNDRRFMEIVYRICREEFMLRCPLTIDQFFTIGYTERKIIFVLDVMKAAQKKIEELSKLDPATKSPPTAHSERSASIAKTAKPSVLISKSGHQTQDVSGFQQAAEFTQRIQLPPRAQTPPVPTRPTAAKAVSWWLGPSHSTSPSRTQHTYQHQDLEEQSNVIEQHSERPQRGSVKWFDEELDQDYDSKRIEAPSSSHQGAPYDLAASSITDDADDSHHRVVVESASGYSRWDGSQQSEPRENDDEYDFEEIPTYKEPIPKISNKHNETSKSSDLLTAQLQQNHAVMKLAESVSILNERLGKVEHLLQSSLGRMESRMTLIESRITFLEGLSTPPNPGHMSQTKQDAKANSTDEVHPYPSKGKLSSRSEQSNGSWKSIEETNDFIGQINQRLQRRYRQRADGDGSQMVQDKS